MKNINILALITARSGSKGIPKKNIKKFNGKPLIEWSIKSAMKNKNISKILVSTDDNKIKRIAKKLGAEVPFLRPKRLSKDNSPSIDAVLHSLKYVKKIDYILLLQPTSPLRMSKDIDKIIKYVLGKNIKSCISVTEVTEYPELMFSLSKLGKLTKQFGKYSTSSLRQDYKKRYRANGALYLSEVNWLKKNKSFITKDTYGYLMPISRSIDIDNEYDWAIAELLMKSKKYKKILNK